MGILINFSVLKLLIQKRDLYEKLKCRWEDNTRIDLTEIGVNMRNWIDLSQDKNY